MHQQRHTRAELHQVSKALLRLHKALLDGERAAYERMHGAITSLVLAHAAVRNLLGVRPQEGRVS
jgi:hypothetical protein